ncbi:MAG: MFS transporter, partial [Sinobacterium sp.]|nr:MFS transporter [Sinobacterium sp.]
AVLTALYYLQVLEVWHIIVLVALNSVFTAFLLPTVAATVPLMVPKGLLTRANGSVALAFGIIELMSPLISGTLYKQFGLMSIFTIDLATFSVGILVIVITFIPQPPKTTEAAKDLEKETFFQSIQHGFRYLKETPSMLQLIFFFCIVAGCIRAIGLMVQPMVLAFGDPQDLGHVMTIAGTGVLLGSILLIPFRDSERHMPIIFGTTIAIAIAAFLTPMTTHIYLLAAGGFVLMACFPMLDANIRTLFQRKIDPALLGRVIGARNFVLGIFQTTIILACGFLADKVFEPAMKEEGGVPSIINDIYGFGTGRGIAIMISGLGIVLVLVIISFYMRKPLRNIDSEIKDIDVDLPITEEMAAK